MSDQDDEKEINIYLDDDDVYRLTPLYHIRTHTVEETIELIKNNKVHILDLDNDLGFPGEPEKEGYQVIRWLEDRHNPANPDRVSTKFLPDIFHVHTGNNERRKDMWVGIRRLQQWRKEEEENENK